MRHLTTADFGVRPRHRSTRWAFQATITSAVAIGAGWMVQSMALPPIIRELGDAEGEHESLVAWLKLAEGWLAFVGVPGLLLGAAAIALKSLRRVLAPLAALAAFVAFAAIVATVLSGMIPMYQMPEELLSGQP